MLSTSAFLTRGPALLRMLPVAALLSLSLGSGCKKKDKKPAAGKDAAAAKSDKDSKKDAAPLRADAAPAGSEWLEVVGLMPDGANNVLGVNFAKVRKTPFWKDIKGAITGDDAGKSLFGALKRCGVGEADLGRLALGGGAQGFGSGVVALSGTDIGNPTKVKCLLGEVEAEVARRAAKDGKKPKKPAKPFYTATKKAGRSAFLVDAGSLGINEDASETERKAYLICVDSNRVLLATEAQMNSVLARLKADAAPISKTLAGIQDKVGSDGSIVVMGLADTDIRRLLEGQGVKGIKDYRASVDLGQGVAIDLRMSMSQAEQAQQAAKLITSKVNEQKPMLGFLSLPPTLLDSLKVEPKGSNVVASLKLSAKEVGAIRSMVKQQAGGGRPGAK